MQLAHVQRGQTSVSFEGLVSVNDREGLPLNTGQFCVRWWPKAVQDMRLEEEKQLGMSPESTVVIRDLLGILGFAQVGDSTNR